VLAVGTEEGGGYGASTGSGLIARNHADNDDDDDDDDDDDPVIFPNAIQGSSNNMITYLPGFHHTDRSQVSFQDKVMSSAGVYTFDLIAGIRKYDVPMKH
jgi:hypothetical protein